MTYLPVPDDVERRRRILELEATVDRLTCGASSAAMQADQIKTLRCQVNQLRLNARIEIERLGTALTTIIAITDKALDHDCEDFGDFLTKIEAIARGALEPK